MEKQIIITIYSLFLILNVNFAFAASIKTVKGQQVLINKDGEDFPEGTELFSKDATGKNKSLLKVTKTGKSQVLAQVLKGKAEEGQTVVVRKTSGASANPFGKVPRKKMGVVGTLLKNTMNAQFSVNSSVNESASMGGTSFGILGVYDFPVAKSFDVRAMGGIEQFVASQTKSSAVCDNGNSATCSVNINYLSMYGVLKYMIPKGKINYWAGGGLGYLLALSKASTVLDTSQISTNQVFVLSLGADIGRPNNKVIPVSLDYSLFPSSGTVTANIISIRVGWAWGK